MKTMTKKLMCLFTVLALTLSLAACGSSGGSENGDGNDPELVEFIDNYGDEFLEGFDEGFSGSGMTCTSSMKVEGTVIVLECRIQGVDDVASEVKAALQDSLDQTKDTMESSMAEFAETAPNLTGIRLDMCEEDGDLLATVEFDV